MSKTLHVSCILIFFLSIAISNAHAQPEPVCSDVRYLMQRNMTPHDFSSAGQTLQPGGTVNARFESGQYSHYYALNAENTLDIRFSEASSGLEFAVFRGMEGISGYRPVENGTTSLALDEEGVYTVVVRRSRIQDVEQSAAYTLTASFTGGGEIELAALRDESIGQRLATPPQLVDGQELITLPSAETRLHPNAATAVASRQGQSAQLIFEANSILVGNWASHIALLGGDLAAHGDTRLLYVQDYGYQVRNIDPALSRLDTSNGTSLKTDWQLIRGVWLTQNCIGVKLDDGRTFTAPVLPDARRASFTGNLDDFQIEVNTPDVPTSISMNWHGIAENSEVRVENGIFQADLIGERRLALQAGEISMFRRIDGELTVNTPLDITLPDSNLMFDWVNLSEFSLMGETMAFEFMDDRGRVERSAVDLMRVEALQDTIVIEYDGEPGEQRLLLPKSESYLEIVTPAGLPAFNSLALPGETGYAPRALNNLGGECYPVNTLLEEANCPPNGHPNPANGNLWYAVTDLIAYGYRIDLTVTRSYNSGASEIDSPFGRGWTTPYLLDYNVPFNNGSRLVTPEITYRTGLDIIWAPRGIVTFTTPSGSRHVFTSEEDEFESGVLTAITMPGWTLQRETVRAGWRLRQLDGLTFEFDRAGRILRYGYPSRLIEIQYQRDSLTGAAGQTAIISDDFSQRQLEIVFDEQHHITRSILRDLTQTSETCDSSQNCFETVYEYQNGLLTNVRYSDGEQAFYEYDEHGRLTGHHDPRAPIHPDMAYAYTSTGIAKITFTDADPMTWRDLSEPQIVSNQRLITLTDERGNAITYTYNLSQNTPLREAGGGYTLDSVTSPLSILTTLDGQPTEYTWTDGLLRQIDAKNDGRGAGRNSTQFEYTPAGQLRRVSGGYLDAAISFDASGLPAGVAFADGTQLTFTSDTITDRQGAVYQLTWDERGWLTTMTRQNDGMKWEYQHNSFGMVTVLNRGGYTVGYTWDALGRLTGIDDPLLGVYTINYTPREMTVTDAVGVEEITRFDLRGRVIETLLKTETSPELRRTTYEYDRLNHIISQTVWVDGEGLATTYIYENETYLPPQPGDTSQVEHTYGYRAMVTDPYGRRTFYHYDALDRLRLIEDPLRRVTRYDYLAEDAAQTNGLRIVQRDIRGDSVIATTTYEFDAHWQLREVARNAGGEDLNWRFSTEGDPARLRFMEAQTSDIRTLTWDMDEFGRVTGIQINPIAVTLESGANQPGARYSVRYDFAGRVTQRIDADGVVTDTVYCLLEDGGRKVIVGAIACDSTTFIEATWYDAHDRVTRIENSESVQTFAYQRDGQNWRVELTTSEMLYDAAGDLLLWTDDTGVTHQYVHDTGGRLRQVMVENEPEASFTIDYNSIGQVTRMVNGLERGTLYQYDERGLLIVEQDILTADATTYAYGPFGEMTSFISPLGNTTSFLYEDPGDPTRLTGIIDPTGALQRFDWNDVENLLTYTDARGNSTQYRFDGLGALRRIDDAAGQSHELRYDATTRLREWASVQTGQNAARTLLLSALENGKITVSEARMSDWSWGFGFNPAGNLTQITDPSGASMEITYDVFNRLEQITAGGNTWSIERQPGESTLNFNNTVLTFDSLYRQRQSGAIIYDYQSGQRGDLILNIEHDGQRTYTFSPGDASARPRTVTLSAPGQTMTYVYNAEGLIDEIQVRTCPANCEESGEWVTSTRFTYDALGRPIRVVDEEQNIETFAYDEAGNLLTYQSANGKTFTYQYDALNRLTTITGATGLRLVMEYDASGHVIAICRMSCDENPLESYTYDRLGRLITQQYPNIAAVGGQTVIEQTYERGMLSAWGARGGQPVTLSYSTDILKLLDGLNTGENYTLNYDDSLRLSGFNDDGYVYDDLGRVIEQTDGKHTLNFDYLANHLGYTVTEAQSGAGLTFLLSEGGWLEALDYGVNVEDVPLLSLEYRLNQPDILTVLSNSDTLTFDFQLDRLEQTLNLVFNYGENRLLADYQVNPAGRVTRQRIDAVPGDFFALDAEGYITVTGYDDDDRVSTVRITDKASGRLLYVMNFTYNDGLRETETHRYADGTQLNIRYDYAETNQLIRRVVSIVRAEPMTSLIPALGLMWALMQKRRRLALVLVTAAVLIISQIQAQQAGETYSYLYTYDAAGNLARIVLEANAAIPENQTCAEYQYDNANRLTHVIQNGRQYVYEYDLYNRLVSASNWNVIYAGDAPLMAYNRAGLTTFYGRLEDHPPLFIAEGNRIRWLLPDGRDRFMTVAQEDEVEPLALLDPLGRPLSLELPNDNLNPCALLPQISTVFNLPQPQITFTGMLWDPLTNLYFKDGRAYLPDIARFLQRDLYGPSGYGLVYDLSMRSPVPTQHHSTFEIGRGLQTLQDAIKITNKRLDAETVRTQFYPSYQPDSHWWDALGEPDSSLETLEGLAAFPAWLQTGYHQPGVTVERLTGALRLNRMSAPGFAAQPGAQPTTLMSPVAVVRAALNMPEVTTYAASSYQAFGWMPDTLTLADTWEIELPDLASAPEDVLDWLPMPLHTPEKTVPVLDMLRQLESLPQLTGRDFVDELLAEALPTPPQLPPENVEAWEAKWFDDDPFGLRQVLAQRYPIPDVPYVPLYDIGVNLEWLQLR